VALTDRISYKKKKSNALTIAEQKAFLERLEQSKYKHLFLLLFWPVFGFFFNNVEVHWPRIWQAITGEALVYTEVVCDLDAYIPFCEWFVIPYYFWFAFIVGMILYSLAFELRAFRYFSWFVILTYTVTGIIYYLWPNMQGLRPTDFPRDNLLVDIVKGLYDFDTNTNVCPSVHCLGSYATAFAGLHSKKLRGIWWKLSFVLTALLISASTVFLKQHSIIDVFAAVGVAAVCYAIQYWIFPGLMTAPKETRESELARSL
jgi:membrane-associated phospholipid phosphatase